MQVEPLRHTQTKLPRGVATHHEILRTLDALAQELDVWNAMVDSSYAGHPFLTMQWQLLWYRHFAQGPSRICCVKFMRGNQVAGYLPLVETTDAAHGIPTRVLRFAGNAYSPVLCPIVADPSGLGIWRYFAQKVLPKLDWDLLEGSNIPEEYPGAQELRAALAAQGIHARLSHADGNWIWEGPPYDSEGYLKSLPGGVRGPIKRYQTHFEGKGRARYRLVSEGVTDADIEEYRGIYGRSWKESEFEPSFHPGLIQLASKAGWLRLGLLYIDDVPVATQLWLVRQGTAYMVKVAHDEAYRKDSPGTALTWKVVQELLDKDGIHTYDLLRGDDDYKKRWATRRRERYVLTAFNHTPKGRALFWLDERALPWMRNNKVMNRIKCQIATGLDNLRAMSRNPRLPSSTNSS